MPWVRRQKSGGYFGGRRMIYRMTRYGIKVPQCKKGLYHSWKQGYEIYGESGVCGKCGYDLFDQRYREERK
jgi:hypothetical protein